MVSEDNERFLNHFTEGKMRPQALGGKRKTSFSQRITGKNLYLLMNPSFWVYGSNRKVNVRREKAIFKV